MRVDTRSSVGFAPAVVVFPGGEEQFTAAWMIREATGPPQGEKLGSEMGMIRLGDDPKQRTFIDYDHDVVKNS